MTAGILFEGKSILFFLLFKGGNCMNEIVKDEAINIENMIYEIRGVQVMLSADVAKIYQVETKRINEVIKRNIDRFPESFCFQLTNEEIEKISSRSQIATLIAQSKNCITFAIKSN